MASVDSIARRVVLIADPDLKTVEGLKATLKDYELLTATDGSKALELSVLRSPDLILFYRRCPLIAAAQFLRILRSNPHTEKTPLVVLSDEPLTADVPSGFFDGALVKPLNLSEVRSYVARIFERLETAKKFSEKAVRGSFDQISIADLLQIFALNRRSGRLSIQGSASEQTAELFIHQGRVEDAIAGAARGAKALYRVLRWTEGTFSFAIGQRATQISISDSTDALLLEGMRQADELARIESILPEPGALLERLVPVDELPAGLHPVTADVYRLAEFFPRVLDLVDKVPASDLEIFQALRSLVDVGVARFASPEAFANVREVLPANDVLELRSRLRRAGLAPIFLTSPKIALLAHSMEQVANFARMLAKLPQYKSFDFARVRDAGFGTLGTLRLDDAVSLEFCLLPQDLHWSPVLRTFSSGAVACVVLGDVPENAPGLRYLEKSRRLAITREEQLPKDSPQKLVATLCKMMGTHDLRALA